MAAAGLFWMIGGPAWRARVACSRGAQRSHDEQRSLNLWHNYTNLDILVAAPPCMPTSPPVLGLFLHSRDRRVTTDGAGSTIPAPGFSGKTLRAPRHGNFRSSTFLRE